MPCADARGGPQPAARGHRGAGRHAERGPDRAAHLGILCVLHPASCSACPHALLACAPIDGAHAEVTSRIAGSHDGRALKQKPESEERCRAAGDGPEWNALQPEAGAFDERVFAALDWVLAEAGARGIHLCLPLLNNWGAYGGIPQYVRWALLSLPFLSCAVGLTATRAMLKHHPYHHNLCHCSIIDSTCTCLQHVSKGSCLSS